MFDRIKQIIVDEICVDEELVKPETKISADLGVDSISFINAVMAIEDEFGVTMDEDRLAELVTVQDLADYVEELKK